MATASVRGGSELEPRGAGGGGSVEVGAEAGAGGGGGNELFATGAAGGGGSDAAVGGI